VTTLVKIQKVAIGYLLRVFAPQRLNPLLSIFESGKYEKSHFSGKLKYFKKPTCAGISGFETY